MADAWIDVPDHPSPHRDGRRTAAVTLAVVAGVMVLVVVVWLRFLSGVSSAPVSASLTDEMPAVAATTTMIPSSPEPSSQSGSSVSSEPSGRVVGSAVLSQTTTVAQPAPTPSASVEPPVDATWLAQVAAATALSPRALQAYAGAQLELEREKPSCRLGWNTLAGIGKVESNNGRVLTDAGYSTSPILGPAVRGNLHAEGPMQFMPGTWAKWGADGNGDGVADPNQIDDAALATARYLCSYGDLDTTSSWHAAVFGYNHLESYVATVAAQATHYAELTAGRG